MREVRVLGVGMTPFGKFVERGLKSLAKGAVDAALEDAALEWRRLEAAWVGNAVAGFITGQESLRGQVVLGAMGIGGMPIVNVDNACASGATAFGQAWAAVASGLCDVALALGVEKMTHPDRARTFKALATGMDVELREEDAEGRAHSVFMDYYARVAEDFMARTGATARHLAWVAAKNHDHGALNPDAQYRFGMTVQQVLEDRRVVGPLTRAMCSPIADGAAAAVLCSAEVARRLGRADAVRVRGYALRAGYGDGDARLAGDDVLARAAAAAYERAGVAPAEIDVAEVHDATALAELTAYASLGLCAPDAIVACVDAERFRLGGALPVNPSGGLECRGHPVGATGLAQIAELTWQLRGQAGARQVEGARLGLAQNAGGLLRGKSAVCAVTILEAP